MRIERFGVLILVLVCSLAPVGEGFGHPQESHNMTLVGFHDLQGRPAYQPTIHSQGGRWIAYVGLHSGAEVNSLAERLEGNGTLIIDVTDAADPRTLAHIPGDRLDPGEESEAQMVRVCDVSGRTYLVRDAASRTRYEVWDVTAPEDPRYVTVIVDGLRSTHKLYWSCDDHVVYLPSLDSEWRARNTKIFDLSDPARPRFIRDFGLVGQEPGSQLEHVPAPIHGPIAHGDKVFFAYGSSNHGTVQIVDRAKLLNGDPEPTPENLLEPQIGRIDMPIIWGGHSTYPLLGVPIKEFEKATVGNVKAILVVASEVVRNECEGPRHPLFFFDISEPQHPFPVSNFLVPEKSGNFCERGGRFGPHSVQESFAPVFYKKIIFVAYFNAGVRAVDVRDPFAPREVGYFIPATTDKTKPVCVERDDGQRCNEAIQTNNVEVDERGLIYIVDRAGTGLHILKLAGEARQIVSPGS